MKFNPIPSQWLGWGQLGFGSYLQVKVKAVAMSLSHLYCCWFITEGSQLKSNAVSLPACHFEYMKLWENNITSLFLQLFLTENSISLTKQQNPPPLSLVWACSAHSPESGTKRLETLSNARNTDSFLCRWIKTDTSNVKCFVKLFCFCVVNKLICYFRAILE